MSVFLLLCWGIENIEQKARKIQRGNRQLSVFAWGKITTKASTNGAQWAWHNLHCSTRFDLTFFKGGRGVVLKQLSKFYAKLCTNVQISLSLFKYTMAVSNWILVGIVFKFY